VSLQKWSERIWVVKLAGEPSFAEEIDSLHQQVRKHDIVPHIVLDLSSVTHMNSSDISALLRTRKLAIDGESQLRVAAPPDPVWAIFLSTGLDKIFDFTPDVATALAGLRMSPDQL
jgi:anti-anti-sigma factor